MFTNIKAKLFVPLCSALLLLFYTPIAFACDGSIASMWSRGSKVREIQYYLHKLNYLKEQPDGIYGNITTGAVKTFQLESNLEATGKVGQMTFDALHLASEGSIAKMGSRGKTVAKIQDYLQKLNYMKDSPDGIYGKITLGAVKSFQLEHGLKATGEVEQITFNALKESFDNQNNYTEYLVQANETLLDIAENFNSSVAAIMVRNDLHSNEIKEGQVLQIPIGIRYRHRITSRSRNKSQPQAIPWSIVDKLWKPGENATLTDLDTGESFTVKRLGGRYHADAEPLTSLDAKTMYKILGNRWSWDRRAIIVNLCTLQIAASMNGMPHGVQNIYGNWFDGHFCIHFLGSRVHVSYSVDDQHLSKIEEAENTFEIDEEEIMSVL